MQQDIPNMQPAKNIPPQTQNKKDHVRRTTIILEEEERQYIDKLIHEGKEAGIKQLVSKMLDVYRSMMIYDWKYPGEYYTGISRVAFINIEFINTLLQSIPSDQHHNVGQKAGEAARISIETTLNLDPADRQKWSDVFKRLRIQGLGDFYRKDKYIIIKAPYINNSEVQRGYLETLLSTSLQTRTETPPFVYEIIKENP